MPSKPRKGLPCPDVLVFFGNRKDLADDLVTILKTLHSNASTVNDLPSNGMTLAEKIEYYLDRAKFYFAIATCDVARNKTYYPAATLITELTRCLKKASDRTMVFLEQGCNLPSTLPTIVHESFPKGNFQKVLPACIKALQRHNLIGGESAVAIISKEEKESLAMFIREMDSLWDCMDKAWDSVYRSDPQTEAAIGVQYDKFFEVYYNGFRSGLKLDPEPITKRAEKLLPDAEHIVATVLNEVLRWKAAESDEEEKRQKQQGMSPARIRQMLSPARAAHTQFNRARTFTAKREAYTEAFQAYNAFLNSSNSGAH